MEFMNGLSAVITFVENKRKILASLFLVIGLLSTIVVGVILVQRPQIFYSKATEKSLSKTLPFLELVSPTGSYRVSYNQRQWDKVDKPDEIFGSRVIFNLRQDYGYARLDIVEGGSEKDLDGIKDEIINKSASKPAGIEFTTYKDKASYLLTFKETVFGEEVFYYRQIIKTNRGFVMFEKRFPQLGYSRNYLEGLLSGISLDDQINSQVKGISDSATNLATVELVDMVRPSIVSIVHAFCVDIINLKPQISKLSKDKYNFCGVLKGSGFVVSERGIIATNGHIAKFYPEEGLATNLLSGGTQAFVTDLIRVTYSSEDFYSRFGSNPQYLDHILTKTLKLAEDGAILMKVGNEKFYVNAGNEPVRIDYRKIESGDINGAIMPSMTTYNADLLDFNYSNKYSYDAVINRKYQLGSDVALLEIKNSSNHLFPMLELGAAQSLREGSDIIIAGYPILVEGGEGPQATIGFKSSTKPTITRGIISAVKQDPLGRTVFQTDASIDRGNSGGPAFDSSGKVVGLATFFFESKSGNFNFLRGATDLWELMSKNNIENKPGNLTIAWRKGLVEFRNRYYKQAIKYFEQVQDLSSGHPTVKEFIALSKDSIKKGESLEGLAGLIKSEKTSNSILVIFGGISMVSFMLAGFLTVLPVFTKRR